MGGCFLFVQKVFKYAKSADRTINENTGRGTVLVYALQHTQTACDSSAGKVLHAGSTVCGGWV